MTNSLKGKCFKIFDYINEYSLYLLIFFIPISTAGIESLFGFLLLSFILKKSLKPDFDYLKTRANLFLLFFIFFMTPSLFNSAPYFAKSLRALFFKWLEYIMVFIIAQDTLSNKVRIRNALAVLVFASGLVCISGLMQKFLGFEFLRHRHMVAIDGGFYGITGPFKHYNDFGSYLAVLFLITCGLLLAKKKIVTKIALIPLEMLLLICLLLTFSRGSFLGVVSAMLFMLIFSRRFTILLSIIFMLIIISSFLPAMRERLASTFQIGGDAERFLVWQGTWNMIKENPFLGKGLGTFMDHFSEYIPNLSVRYAHNCFLQIWAETGIFSLLSFFGFLSLILTKAIKTFQKTKDFVFLGIICAIFALLVHSFFDNDLYSLQLAVLFWFILALALTRLKIYGKS